MSWGGSSSHCLRAVAATHWDFPVLRGRAKLRHETDKWPLELARSPGQVASAPRVRRGRKSFDGHRQIANLRTLQPKAEGQTSRANHQIDPRLYVVHLYNSTVDTLALRSSLFALNARLLLATLSPPILLLLLLLLLLPPLLPLLSHPPPLLSRRCHGRCPGRTTP